jgi:cystathionine beta-lyase/cystathionine gamma-synthase
MSEPIDDVCPRPSRVPPLDTEPHAPPIYLSSVYECRDPQQAADLLSGKLPGHVYSRDSHPNADLLAEKCRELHAAERAAITSSGMAALALAVLSQLEHGDHLVVSNQLYGRSLSLFTQETARLGIDSTVVDTCDLKAVEKACHAKTRLVAVETISNPVLRVADIRSLAKVAKAAGARLLVDNTFAGPALCRPLEQGADLVMESLTKTMNGHSDVVLGLLCGPESLWQRVPTASSSWGLSSAPFDCWLVLRGLGTLALRIDRASSNALAVAEFLAKQKGLDAVHYPGLKIHPDHELARQQFGDRYGSIVTFTLSGGTRAAEAFIAGSRIPFCPSLGELSTTLSHPESTSHRTLPAAARAALGITGGTIRLSVGIESPESVVAAVAAGLASADK